MPRKTKEPIENKNTKTKGTSLAKTGETSLTQIKETSPAKNKAKITSSKSTTKKATSRKTTTKAATTRKTGTGKTTSRTATSKSVIARKASSLKSSADAEKDSITSKKKVEVVEYYDLPYRYNQTVVKLLAQTPSTLFIYWDISDEDRKSFEKQYGEKFFEQTKPVLIVRNETLNYSFEVEINDFANSWYLHVADSKCNYKIELGRRPITKTEKLNVDYIYLTTSNKIESPNDHILFNPEQKMVYFRDVKTGIQTGKSIQNISFIRNMGKIYNIYDLYQKIYQNEDVNEIYDISNPSSGSNHIF